MYTYKCRINKVLDGDTVEIDLDLGFNTTLANQKVRLLGIDTPESRTTNKEEKVRGLLSKKKLQEKLVVGSYVKIITHKNDNNDDKFGRILGEFILEKIFEKVRGDIWEIKAHRGKEQFRLYAFWDDALVVAAVGVEKKWQKARGADVELAEKRRRDHLARKMSAAQPK